LLIHDLKQPKLIPIKLLSLIVFSGKSNLLWPTLPFNLINLQWNSNVILTHNYL
jgi:hypothetical protein